MTLPEALAMFDSPSGELRWIEINGEAVPVPYCCGAPLVANSQSGVERIYCPVCARGVRFEYSRGWVLDHGGQRHDSASVH